MKNTTPHNYFAYARKSTDTEDRQVRSIGDQLSEMRDVAERFGLEITDLFTESQTAKAAGRPVFNDMLARIEAGEADGLLAWHPDRLARNWTDAGRILGMIDSGTIKDLKFAVYPFDMTSAGKFNLASAFCQSKYYVDNISDNVKRAFRQMLKNGLWPEKAPIGYLNDRRSPTLVVDPERSLFIQKAFELYGTGRYTLAQVRASLTEMGFLSRSGNQLSISNVQYVLKNSFYYGLMRFKGEYYEGKHPPLVSKELFDKAQTVMTAKSQPRRHAKLKPYLYRSMFTCGECGCMITIETQKGHNYLRCTRKKTRCTQPFLREEVAAAEISQAIKQFAVPVETTEWLVAELEKDRHEHLHTLNQETNRIREEIRKKSGQIERLIFALTDGTLSPDEFRTAKNRVVLEKRDLEEKAVTLEKNRTNWLEPAIRFVKACKEATLLTNSGTPTECRDFFRKAGSNRTLLNKRVAWEPRGAWKTLVNAGRLAQHEIAASVGDAAIVGELNQHGFKLGD
jgi:site-specific DNA recombinase